MLVVMPAVINGEVDLSWSSFDDEIMGGESPLTFSLLLCTNPHPTTDVVMAAAAGDNAASGRLKRGVLPCPELFGATSKKFLLVPMADVENRVVRSTGRVG
jgi:hypothetical protein